MTLGGAAFVGDAVVFGHLGPISLTGAIFGAGALLALEALRQERS
jgi:hypothetical protein